MLKWLKGILNRSCWVYAIVVIVFALSVDFSKAFDQRSNYLLGIFYNGHFKNQQDRVVYVDYMRKHQRGKP